MDLLPVLLISLARFIACADVLDQALLLPGQGRRKITFPRVLLAWLFSPVGLHGRVAYF